MTLGEQQTESAAKTALKLLGEDERQAVLAWVDDRERVARNYAATTATGMAGARAFGTYAGILLSIGAIAGTFGYMAGVFEHAPKGCPVCPEVVPCATPAALDWFPTFVDHPASSPRIPDVRYAETSKQQCVAIGDAVLCTPTRVPPAFPSQVTP